MTVPQIFYPEQVDTTLINSFVTKAETLGFESLWVQERIIGGVNSLEPINLLSYVSALTQTIKLGTSVLVASTRNPIMLAKELTTLDHLSDGRLIVGIGLGGRVEQYHLFGAPSEHRVRFFMESIRGALSGLLLGIGWGTDEPETGTNTPPPYMDRWHTSQRSETFG